MPASRYAYHKDDRVRVNIYALENVSALFLIIGVNLINNIFVKIIIYLIISIGTCFIDSLLLYSDVVCSLCRLVLYLFVLIAERVVLG